MDKNREKTVLALRELATGERGRSETAQLRDIINEVEAALSAGVKRGFVLDTLRQNYGFKMSMSGFEKSLASIRKERKVSGQPRIVSKAPPPPTTVNSDKTATETERIPRITNPKELYESQQELRIEIDNYAQDHQYEE